ncbi:hypothetical protein G6F57_008818 [Rhizopus arrhizus]|uniref:TLDc domain-containing protein n=1 Tax=Rhizopus oryzae TaxID=64495 RepID=A0A9P7BQJ1_RHIOR|nr:hypothetical protein G6F23_003788 [Rhizopus arrhizus]KAG1417508.1 hypothetical protein G6F58_005485 [Rhizopus delemar]KAG0767557.1 hypothetical protein G6F24_002678 [Rhizopus arrhizus]KAG0786110.1 hypothetical protein G6F21_008821 [Rhizopus arrhizus]KAG0798731.1 hypothetical protein G6F22_003931 [Rhizopus arrhizus]
MGQSNTKPHVEKAETFNPNGYLSKVELVSIKCVFNSLKSDFPDNFHCLEPKQFLERLGLPKEIEEAGVLLFKALSYLGSFPSSIVKGPVPLSLHAFLTAFVVLVGRLDKPDHPLSELLFFQALSILPNPEQEEQEQVKIEEATNTLEPPTQPGHARGLSLETLGIDFSDLDMDTADQEEENKGPEILCRDMVELLILLLWLGGNDDLAENQKIAKSSINHLEKSKDGTCISYKVFCEWKSTFSPHIFKPIQSFLIQSFAYVEPNKLQRVLPEDAIPRVDKTDILTHMHCTLISWALPEKTLNVKQWTRLYSSQQDGFSMNRFENHVFKYPGPTLLVMNIEARAPRRYSIQNTSDANKTQYMLVGVYVSQAWKNSKHFWGTHECFLFELEPHFDIYRPKSQNDHYIYYNHDTGVGFGAREEQGFSEFIISLQNTLQEGVYENEAYPGCPTFESGTRKNQDFKYLFETENIEVFGLGTEKDKDKQLKEWEFDKKEALRRSGLNIRKSDGQLDKELLKMAGIIDEDKRQDR